MLRTMITDTPFEQKWVLQDRLCRQWVDDLKGRWESTRTARKSRWCIVDLEDVISVDTQGEDLLLEMVAEGAILFASRSYMKHIGESLHVPPNSARRGA
jgi:hypothetical protein